MQLWDNFLERLLVQLNRGTRSLQERYQRAREESAKCLFFQSSEIVKAIVPWKSMQRSHRQIDDCTHHFPVTPIQVVERREKQLAKCSIKNYVMKLVGVIIVVRCGPFLQRQRTRSLYGSSSVRDIKQGAGSGTSATTALKNNCNDMCLTTPYNTEAKKKGSAIIMALVPSRWTQVSNKAPYAYVEQAWWMARARYRLQTDQSHG